MCRLSASMFDECCLRGQIFAPAISAFTTSLWLSCALGQDARKYDYKEVGGRVAPGAATENNAGAVVEQAHLLCCDEGTLHVFYEGLVTRGVFLWFGFFSREKEKLPGAIFNMLCMARRVNTMDGIHK